MNTEPTTVTCPKVDLLNRLELAAANYDRVEKSLSSWWEWAARRDCREKAAALREAIEIVKNHSRVISDDAFEALKFVWRAPRGVSMNQARMAMAVKFGAHVEAELETILGEKTNN